MKKRAECDVKPDKMRGPGSKNGARRASGAGSGGSFGVGSQLLAEQYAEDQTAQGTAVKQLPQKGHGQIAAEGLHPGAEAGLLEQQGGCLLYTSRCV